MITSMCKQWFVLGLVLMLSVVLVSPHVYASHDYSSLYGDSEYGSARSYGFSGGRVIESFSRDYSIDRNEVRNQFSFANHDATGSSSQIAAGTASASASGLGLYPNYGYYSNSPYGSSYDNYAYYNYPQYAGYGNQNYNSNNNANFNQNYNTNFVQSFRDSSGSNASYSFSEKLKDTIKLDRYMRADDYQNQYDRRGGGYDDYYPSGSRYYYDSNDDDYRLSIGGYDDRYYPRSTSRYDGIYGRGRYYDDGFVIRQSSSGKPIYRY